MPLLEFRDVWKRYASDYVLREVNLAVDVGSFLAVVGPNGSGKTTLLRLASGLIAPSKGEVLISGKNARRPEAKKLLGYVPHQPPLYGDLTVEENLLYYAGLHGIEGLETIEDLLEDMGLRDYMDRRVGELSYGWRKRVDIARALLPDPPLLLMDEPFSGLDEVARSWLRDLFIEAISGGRRAVVITSPHPEDLRDDLKGVKVKVAEIREGRIIATPD